MTVSALQFIFKMKLSLLVWHTESSNLTPNNLFSLTISISCLHDICYIRNMALYKYTYIGWCFKNCFLIKKIFLLFCFSPSQPSRWNPEITFPKLLQVGLREWLLPFAIMLCAYYSHSSIPTVLGLFDFPSVSLNLLLAPWA